MQTTTNLISIMQQGGAVMWPLYALLVITVVLSVERTITLIILWRNKEPVVKAQVETPLSILDLIAMIAPVLGFLGTVTGMISAFKSVSEASSVQLQVVAAGLYEALFTTAFGLIISILATIASFALDLAIGALCESEKS
ncbi:MAG: MotA/TolQ/ExbB proton channel family protein [Sphaerochaeta sp.]|jgi:biopolymer transport protein ExbB/TolQ|uniref:MotA/TolQ/ExbB proton channel family protein n=1 Tax=unclassified Sphaerochaeta TaxID=2637943 RepID=UPI00262FDA56|nr:MotA/TolQ/ExbB proton channel family protein [Sphaerochaeta sp.]MDX9826007.1 MotA/TolQ/ExbB proton channel family protein [Sphaerochaeta sp.]HPE92950.1 MotA/TolQ/ExbB proton channel family protein [Sphaerochaeta sp.]